MRLLLEKTLLLSELQSNSVGLLTAYGGWLTCRPLSDDILVTSYPES